MPSPEAIRAIERFQRRLDALDEAAARELVNAYGPIYQRIASDVDALIQEAMRRELTVGEILRLKRLRDLRAQIVTELARFGDVATDIIRVGQGGAVALAQESARRIVDAALPLGVDTQLLAAAGIQWNALPARAFEVFVGIAGDGAPLGDLLAALGPEVRAGVTNAIAEGIGRGWSPRKTADLVRQRFGMGLTRALAISRTETLRAYRESSRLQYVANGAIVKRWRRVAAHDDRVCMACLALDGQEQDTDELVPVHVNDRCGIAPVTISYRDLGLDVPDDPRTVPTARDWFLTQDEAAQQRMMGPGRFTAWKSGKFDLQDMAKVTDDPTWGPTASEKTLKELTGV